MQQKVPFSLIRCSSSKVAFCSCVEWGWHIYNIVESESDPLTRRVVDVFEKEPLKGNSEVHLHTPTKFGDDRSKDLGGDREQTDRQTNRQTDKRCSIYSMMYKAPYQSSVYCIWDWGNCPQTIDDCNNLTWGVGITVNAQQLHIGSVFVVQLHQRIVWCNCGDCPYING